MESHELPVIFVDAEDAWLHLQDDLCTMATTVSKVESSADCISLLKEQQLPDALVFCNVDACNALEFLSLLHHLRNFCSDSNVSVAACTRIFDASFLTLLLEHGVSQVIHPHPDSRQFKIQLCCTVLQAVNKKAATTARLQAAESEETSIEPAHKIRRRTTSDLVIFMSKSNLLPESANPQRAPEETPEIPETMGPKTSFVMRMLGTLRSGLGRRRCRSLTEPADVVAARSDSASGMHYQDVASKISSMREDSASALTSSPSKRTRAFVPFVPVLDETC